MEIITSTYSKSLTKDTTFANYLLILDVFSKLTKLCGIENINTKEVMDKLDMFRARCVTVDEFGWWDIEIIQNDSGMQFTSK